MAVRSNVMIVDISSSAIDSVEWNRSTKVLTVNFRDGSRHSYKITAKQFREFMKAPSKGRYFNLHIRE